MASISDKLVSNLSTLSFADLDAATVHAACRVLLDATGVMLGASGMAAETLPFLTVAKLSGDGPCRVLGTGVDVAAPAAALANGALAHALDYDDAFDPAPGHPNASLVPALIALSQQGEPVDGRRFIAALVAGCELSCRLGLAVRQPLEVGGWYPPPIFAGFGATAGAAHLLGLSPTAMRDALSLALCQVTVPGEIKHSATTVIRAVREAFPAQAAVLSALLAREGVAGFEQPIEGRSAFYALYAGGVFDEKALLVGPEHGWWIEQLTFKPWPSCRGTHPFIDMALEARRVIAERDIDRILVRHDEVQSMLVDPIDRKRAPTVPIDAKFSIPFCVAAAFTDGSVSLDSFTPAKVADPAILALAAKVDAECRADADWKRGLGGELIVTFADGSTETVRRTNAPGGPDAPLDDDALIVKFIDCAGRAAHPLAADAARRLADAILALPDIEDVGALLRT